RPLRLHAGRLAARRRAGAVRPAPGRHRGLRAPGRRLRRAPGVAPRLARPGRGPRVRVRGPLAPRPPRPRRRHADRLPRAPRPAARADLTTVTPGELASLGSAALPDEELTA